MKSGHAFLFLVTIYIFSAVQLSANPGQGFDFIVSQDDTGDFKTIQEAFDAVPHLRKNRTAIFVRNGTYKEKLILPSTKINVSLIGEDREKTIITFDDYASRKNVFGEEMGTSGSSGFYIFGDGFIAQNITFSNSAGPVGQAVAVRIDGDKVMFENCKFLGYQDTLYPHGEKSRQYYRNCYIEGSVDFIFGWSTVLFEDCTIFCKEGGYVTAASTPETSEFGFVFLRCKIIGDAPKHSFYLGRPWRPYSKVVFLECELGDHIKPEGWHNWNKPDAEKSAFYAEYKCFGPGSGTTNRVSWSHQLSDQDAEKYVAARILGDWIID